MSPLTPEIILSDALSSGPAIPLTGFGFRLSISVSTNGDDIWPGMATTLPIPPNAGEQMSVVSTSAADSSVGTGARTIQIRYLNNNGDPKEETITTNGTT